jgi:hypothetical protein
MLERVSAGLLLFGPARWRKKVLQERTPPILEFVEKCGQERAASATGEDRLREPCPDRLASTAANARACAADVKQLRQRAPTR